MVAMVSVFALVAVVLVVSALVAGVVEGALLSFPMIFLGLGFALGPHGATILNVTVDSRSLETVGVLTLSLVLFLDAVHLEVEDLR
ncbi:MAG: hypothetical protein ACRDN9_21345, partial [Streptosporangiaceae bacterium]